MKLLVCLTFVIGAVCVQAQQQLIPNNYLDVVVGQLSGVVPTLDSIVVNYTRIDHALAPQIVSGIDQLNAVLRNLVKAKPILLPLGIPVVLVFTQLQKNFLTTILSAKQIVAGIVAEVIRPNGQLILQNVVPGLQQVAVAAADAFSQVEGLFKTAIKEVTPLSPLLLLSPLAPLAKQTLVWLLYLDNATKYAAALWQQQASAALASTGNDVANLIALATAAENVAADLAYVLAGTHTAVYDLLNIANGLAAR